MIFIKVLGGNYSSKRKIENTTVTMEFQHAKARSREEAKHLRSDFLAFYMDIQGIKCRLGSAFIFSYLILSSCSIKNLWLFICFVCLNITGSQLQLITSTAVDLFIHRLPLLT